MIFGERPENAAPTLPPGLWAAAGRQSIQWSTAVQGQGPPFEVTLPPLAAPPGTVALLLSLLPLPQAASS